jgi:hypothetical protein
VRVVKRVGLSAAETGVPEPPSEWFDTLFQFQVYAHEAFAEKRTSVPEASVV